MVKQFKSKNSSKKLKTLKNITLYPTKKYKKRKNNLKIINLECYIIKLR